MAAKPDRILPVPSSLRGQLAVLNFEGWSDQSFGFCGWSFTHLHPSFSMRFVGELHSLKIFRLDPKNAGPWKMFSFKYLCPAVCFLGECREVIQNGLFRTRWEKDRINKLPSKNYMRVPVVIASIFSLPLTSFLGRGIFTSYQQLRQGDSINQ